MELVEIFNTSISMAQKNVYKAVVLKSLPEKMKTAQILYCEFVFEPIPAYSVNSDIGVECYHYSFNPNT